MHAAPAAQGLPGLLSQVGRKGRQEHGKCFKNFFQQDAILLLTGDPAAVVIDCINQLHHRADRRVEIESFLDIDGNFFDGPVQGPLQLYLRRPRDTCAPFAAPGLFLPFFNEAPDPLQEAVASFHTLIVPVEILLRRGGKKDEKASGVGTVALHNLIGRDHVALRFRHLRPILVDHALGQETTEGLLDPDQASIVEHLCKEAGVKQMQHGMLDPADILIHRHPIIRRFPIKGKVLQLRAGIAQKIPGRTDEGIHGIGFAPGLSATDRAGGMDKRFIMGKRRHAIAGQIRRRGQQDRQIAFRYRHRAAAVAVDHRYGCAPVALARNQPVAQAVGDLEAAAALFLQFFGDGGSPFSATKAVELTGIDHQPLAGVGQFKRIALFAGFRRGRTDHRFDGQVMAAGKKIIAFIMRRHPHYRTGAVGHDHVIAHENGHGLAAQGIEGVPPGKKPHLGRILRGPLNFALPPDPGREFHDLFLPLCSCYQTRQQGMLRSEHHIGYPKKGVGAGRKNREALLREVLYLKGYLRPLAAADPVLLHHLDPLRPVLQRGQIV